MKTNFQARGKRAFTLIELLAVMAIMGILLAVVVPSISGVNESNNINQGGQTFADQVSLARQIASADNITVEVRCLQLLPLPPLPASGYTGILLWSPSRSAAVSRLVKLPNGIAISQDKTTFSTLFGSFTSSGTMLLPGGTTSYVSFTVNPTGMVGPLNLASTADVPPNMHQMTVAILPARSASATSLASVKNYALVQVNPITAATLIYRP